MLFQNLWFKIEHERIKDQTICIGVAAGSALNPDVIHDGYA